ncbi:MAG: MotA/TolQ/ExbB proton channel family protein [Bacteroidales bacterium]|nr:MotA/TolQ/ExbB proton channel family protein [Bacteroidales bacterium]
MKNLISLLVVFGVFFLMTSVCFAQEVTTSGGDQVVHQMLKQRFIEGGVAWMTPILLVLIVGLALCIERILYVNLSAINAEKFLLKVEEALNQSGIEGAKDICRNTKGPVASIFFQGLDRYSEGLDVVEKSIVSYGSIHAARLEKNLSWITLFIAMAPNLGFLGTVIGIVYAFDDISKAGDISPTIVADGMRVALITTIFGLITAMILQVFFNYIVTRIERIVNDMEDASISIMDILIKYKNN